MYNLYVFSLIPSRHSRATLSLRRRAGSRSDSPPDCHSLRVVTLRYPQERAFGLEFFRFATHRRRFLFATSLSVGSADTCLAEARSRLGSDSPPDCHSLPRRRFATRRERLCCMRQSNAQESQFIFVFFFTKT